MYLDERIRDYVVALVAATRRPREIGLPELAHFIGFGASPRATLAFSEAGRAMAFLRGDGEAPTFLALCQILGEVGEMALRGAEDRMQALEAFDLVLLFGPASDCRRQFASDAQLGELGLQHAQVFINGASNGDQPVVV